MLSPLAPRLSKLRRHDIFWSEFLISFGGEAAQMLFGRPGIRRASWLSYGADLIWLLCRLRDFGPRG